MKHISVNVSWDYNIVKSILYILYILSIYTLKGGSIALISHIISPKMYNYAKIYILGFLIGITLLLFDTTVPVIASYIRVAIGLGLGLGIVLRLIEVKSLWEDPKKDFVF